MWRQGLAVGCGSAYSSRLIKFLYNLALYLTDLLELNVYMYSAKSWFVIYLVIQQKAISRVNTWNYSVKRCPKESRFIGLNVCTCSKFPRFPHLFMAHSCPAARTARRTGDSTGMSSYSGSVPSGSHRVSCAFPAHEIAGGKEPLVPHGAAPFNRQLAQNGTPVPP